jgi:polyhydroxybutyrate depolymerase
MPRTFRLAALGLAGLAVAVADALAATPLPPPYGAVVARLDRTLLDRGPLDQGCGRPPPAAAPSSVEVDHRRRELITVVPEGYDPAQPHALVIAFHGRTSSSAKVRRYYDLERFAGGPTIFVYPSGLRARAGGYSWSAPDDAATLPDYALFDAVLARITRSYCIDPLRIFAVGHSLGAWYVNSLGCARGGVLRAIGTLAGGISGSHCRGAVAAALFHNPDDRLVAVSHGREARDLFRAHNGLDGPGRTTSLQGFACRRYGDPAASNPVVWCPHGRDRTRSGRYYPHHWPAGAGAAMMQFFTSLPAPGTASAAASPSPTPEG